MLVQFVLVVFALFAVLSLVVDVGYARITQAQMQSAADGAALEGLRLRNVGVLNPATGQTVDDPFASDCLRRSAAHRLVGWTFDDDLDVTNGDPDQFGAGPVIDVTDGVTNLHALQTMSVPDVHVYKPTLQINQQNVVHGDMVSGRFCYSADPAASEGLAYADPDTIVCTEPQHADGAYARNDFNPNPTTPQPPIALASCPPADDPPPDPWPIPSTGSLNGVDDSAFLVRLRRSNEIPDAGQIEPDVASSGPSLPLVFGRGTTILGDDPTGGPSIRRDGFTVRAAAIAEIRPAMHIGLPQTNPSLPGIAAFTLRDAFVATLNAAGAQATINTANGVICSGVIAPANIGACVAVAPNAVGRFVANRRTIDTVGQALPGAAAVGCAAATAASGYGAVFSAMTSGVNRIVGFTRISSSPDPARPPNAAACPAVISHGVSLVAASNATAILTTGLPLPVAEQPGDVTELLDKNLVRNGAINYAPVLVPVLAR